MSLSIIFSKPKNYPDFYKQVIGEVTIYKLPNKPYKLTSNVILTKLGSNEIITYANDSIDSRMANIDIDDLQIRSRKITKGQPISNSICEQQITFNVWLHTV